MNELVTFLNARIDEDERYLESNKHHLWTQRPFREVEAKRRLIEEITSRSTPDVAEIYLAALACAYSAHPDYRPGWAPEGVMP